MLSQDIEIGICEQKDKFMIENLIQFYFYDLLQSSKLATYQFMPNGLIEKMPYFDNYWEEKNRYPFLVRQSTIPIGFALVHDITLNQQANWKMAEFFILSPYRKKGIGKAVANYIFNQIPGHWEISILKDNEIAINFWRQFFPNDITAKTYEQYPHYLVYEIRK